MLYNISDFGDRWGPAFLNNSEEYDFIRDNMGIFVFNWDSPCYIGGSCEVF